LDVSKSSCYLLVWLRGGVYELIRLYNGPRVHPGVLLTSKLEEMLLNLKEFNRGIARA